MSGTVKCEGVKPSTKNRMQIVDLSIFLKAAGGPGDTGLCLKHKKPDEVM